MSEPDAKYWPAGPETITVSCPWCNQDTKTFIGRCRLDDDMPSPGRPDNCDRCDRDIIVEAHEDGIHVFQAEIPLSNKKRLDLSRPIVFDPRLPNDRRPKRLRARA